MINIVNHHTAYNYSKFTARPHYDVALAYKNKNKKETQHLKSNSFQNNHLNLSLNLFKYLNIRPEKGLVVTRNSKVKNQTALNKQFTAAYPKAGSYKGLLEQLNKLKQNPFEKQAHFQKKALLGNSSKRIQSDARFFKTKELLCWRSDLAFFNLRNYFLNSLKALHLCWAAVRNHKKIVFVGADQDLLSRACLTSVCQIFKEKFLKRDNIPRLKHASWWVLNSKLNADQPEQTQIKKLAQPRNYKFNSLKPLLVNPEYKPGNPTMHKQALHSFNNVLLGQLSGLITNYKENLAQNSNKKQNIESAKTTDDSKYALKQNVKTRYLQSKFVVAASRLNAIVYNHTCTGLFSNPENPLKQMFNHNAVLPSMINDQTINNRLKPSSHINNNFLNFITLSPRTVEPFTHTTLKRVFQKPLARDELHSMPAISKASNKRKNTKHSAWFNFGPLAHINHYTQPALNFGQTTNSRTAPRFIAYNNTLRKKFRAAHRSNTPLILKHAFNNPRRIKNLSYKRKIQALNITAQRDLKMKKWMVNKNYYDSKVFVNLHSQFQHFAKNPILKQADIIFFTNPDKAPGLAKQAYQLRIPTIGIVSGLKSNIANGGRHNNQMDNVSYPILGNPENSFFVLMIIRSFMNLIVKADQSHAMKKSKSTVENNY